MPMQGQLPLPQVGQGQVYNMHVCVKLQIAIQVLENLEYAQWLIPVSDRQVYSVAAAVSVPLWRLSTFAGARKAGRV